ncbi:Fic family protein [Mesorhizobium erdmanii]|uniref:Fic family protein n=1 Tax=Mesorhizobium TaxID=68287 RepID=UPI003CCDF135
MSCLATPSVQESCSGGAFYQGPAQNLDAVVAAAIFAFGFVYIHQFEDGNGRIHRYLIHHVVAMHRFNRREWCSRIGRDPEGLRASRHQHQQ